MYQLEPGSLQLRAVRAWSDRNNLICTAPHRTSPPSSVQLLIVEYCTWLANMGSPLCRDQDNMLSESLVFGTDIKDEFIKFKAKLRLLQAGSNSNSSCISSSTSSKESIGLAWYHGSMHQNSANVSCKSGAIKDIKYHTWCVFDTFQAMYNHVYEKWLRHELQLTLMQK